MNNWKNVEGVRKYLQDLIDKMLLRMQKKMKGALSEPKMKLLRKNERGWGRIIMLLCHYAKT